MNPLRFSGLKLRTTVERWPLVTPFRITGHVFDAVELAVVELEQDGLAGRGEAAGVYYLGEGAGEIVRRLESERAIFAKELGRDILLDLLPAGGARNAVDCALWDLEAKASGVPAWQRAGVRKPEPLLTTFTCGVGTPDEMAAMAQGFAQARALKLKLPGEAIDADRVRAVRAVAPDCWLGVDANQGMTLDMLIDMLPAFAEANVALVEQPLPMGAEAMLDGVDRPIPIAADESAQTTESLAGLSGRFDVINIKLDKCGGLTAGLAMAEEARRRGFKPMVGNMLGTSLAMAPAFILGQLCDVVDLDGPTLLEHDRAPVTVYRDGLVSLSEAWGYPDPAKC